ncbi:MAG TPA: helix-turn-helix transcriptional regulator [Caldimonas sp.]|jgi:DNA-binding transcriptional ArsR family regulator|nr:helix-turn-helix transcriptional regulator [Caldimonas sp.]HEX2543010.1 helix-turn-helix transcriptional regulator [Caldimonas sp.]
MNTNEVARIASLVGEPSRTAMLLQLMDGRALTANELATAAGVLAPTASRHLAQLVEGGLLKVEQHGRHRYHRLASADVATLLEGIMQMAAARDPARRAVVVGPREAAMRRARSCYDHIAGRLGVAIAAKLTDDEAIVFDGELGRVSPHVNAALAPLGIDLHRATTGTGAVRRVACRPCLDWSERRFHVAGTLGSALCAHCLDRGWLLRRAGSRALDVTPTGQRALATWLGDERWRWVDGAGEPAPSARDRRRA